MPGHDAVSFLSDLGSGSELVGVVHAVLADLSPGTRVVDLAHDLPAFDVRAASLALARCVPYVPAGVLLVGVDPHPAAAIAVEVAGGRGVFVGPDNGVLAPGVALAGGAERAVVLNRVEWHLDAPGSTFRTRDVFAPVAAALANGTPLDELGDAVDPVGLMPSLIPVPRVENDELVAEITWIDRFGNAQLNVGPDDLVGAFGPAIDRVRVRVGDHIRSMPLAAGYADLPTAGPGLVIDASGMFCVAVDRSSAAFELALGVGDPVFLGDTPERDGGVETPVRLGRRPGEK